MNHSTTISHSDISHELLTKREDTTEAKKVIKFIHKNECMITDNIGNLDGAHVFPAGPYGDLKTYPAFIVPLMNGFHREMDKISDPIARLHYLKIKILPEKKWLLSLHVKAMIEILGNRKEYTREFKETSAYFINIMEIENEDDFSWRVETGAVAKAFRERPWIT